MALSPQDKAFYEEKLGLKSFGYVFGATVLTGAVIWPVLLYVADWSNGSTKDWSSTVVCNLAAKGFLLGSVVAVIMYLLFKLFLELGWLPSRR